MIQRLVGRLRADTMLLSAALRSPLLGPLSLLTMSWMLMPLRPRSAVLCGGEVRGGGPLDSGGP